MQNLKSLVGKFLLQKLREPRIFFDGEHMCARDERMFGQRSKTGTDFHNVVTRSQLCLLDDPDGEVLIVKEILPERLDWFDANLAQDLVHLRKLYGHTEVDSVLRANFAILFTKRCEQNARLRRRYSQVIQPKPRVVEITPPFSLFSFGSVDLSLSKRAIRLLTTPQI